MSKGSWKRPVFVSHEKYSRNFDRIFGVPEEDRVDGEEFEILSVECEVCRVENQVRSDADFFVCVGCEQRSRV